MAAPAPSGGGSGSGGSNFNIDTFTSKLTKGGALASLFEVELIATSGTLGSIDAFKFLCKGVSLPASTITAATVTYMGRGLQIPGNREAAQIVTSVYNDEDMEIRNYIESWMERLNSHRSNKRDSTMVRILDYTGTMKVRQLRKDGTGSSKEYEFVDCWPSACPEIALSWESNEIQSFDITWEFNYWKSVDSNTGQS